MKRHFTEEAFLFSTFVEFNKCWSSGKKSRLVIESLNGFAFVSFSAFLGHPKTMHSAPREKLNPGRKSKKKSKRKTERDNERAARFHEKKRQEREATVSEASKDTQSSPSIPSAASSPKAAFTFSEPAPADVSADSSFSKMNVDGNVTSLSVADNSSSEARGSNTKESLSGTSHRNTQENADQMQLFMQKLQVLQATVDQTNESIIKE